MKVLVTGATGFIGRYVIADLRTRGIEVVATARKEPGNVQPADAVTFINHSIGDEAPDENLFAKFGSPDAAIHLAWSGLPNYKQLFHFETVLPAQYAFIKNLIVNGLNDITIAGTCFEYGRREGCLDESMPARPENPYALAKVTLYHFLEELRKVQPFHLKWTRLFYMYGQGQSPTSIFSQLDKALQADEAVFNMSHGRQLRDYLPVEAMARYLVDIALQQKQDGIINCCSGRPVSIGDLVQEYLNLRGKSIELNRGFYPLPDYEPENFWGSTQKLSKILTAA